MTKQVTRWLLASLLCLALWPGATHGQSPELDQAYTQYREFYAQGRYQEALPFAEKAVKLSKNELGTYHPITATLLASMSGCSSIQSSRDPMSRTASSLRYQSSSEAKVRP